jgi:aminoglycoside N3'-acetyltransferase
MSVKAISQVSKKQYISKEQLIKDFRNMGLKQGDHVAIALSLKKIGYLKGGANEFIDALIETVGSRGTIMMNTFTGVYPLSAIPPDFVFDSNITQADTGIVPETFRKRKGVIRSKHPTCSFSAFGRYKKYLTEGHDEKSAKYLPFTRLAKIDGKFLCIGLGHKLVAIRHEAQNQAGLSNVVPLYYGIKYAGDQKKAKIFLHNFPGCMTKLPKLVPTLIENGLLKSGSVGLAQSYIGSVGELIDSMTMMLKQNPELYLCNNMFCLWCRELERRMNLFNKIKNPRFFQKNSFISNFIALFNLVRLKRFNLLIFQEGKNSYNNSKYSKFHIAKEFLEDLNLVIRSHCQLTKQQV